MWTSAEVVLLRDQYPVEDIEEVMIALPDRTLDAIRIKASRLNIERVTPTLDIFLRIERDPRINLVGPDGEKITITPRDRERF